MLQVARVPETLTAAEYLDLFRSYYPRPLAQDEVIRIAGLQEIAKKQFKDLSGGQKQRLLFALSICGDPDLVFLDEPTLGMDIETRHALWTQVRALSGRGKSVLLTTHYLEEADTLAHRIAVIARGKVVAEGTPVDIKAQVSGRKVRCVTAVPEAQMRALPGVVNVEYIGSAVTLTVKQAEPVLRALLALDTTLHSLEVTSPNLEDAFLALTQDKYAQPHSFTGGKHSRFDRSRTALPSCEAKKPASLLCAVTLALYRSNHHEHRDPFCRTRTATAALCERNQVRVSAPPARTRLLRRDHRLSRHVLPLVRRGRREQLVRGSLARQVPAGPPTASLAWWAAACSASA